STLATPQPTLLAIGALAAARPTQDSRPLEDCPYITASTTPSASGVLVTRVYSVKPRQEPAHHPRKRDHYNFRESCNSRHERERVSDTFAFKSDCACVEGVKIHSCLRPRSPPLPCCFTTYSGCCPIRLLGNMSQPSRTHPKLPLRTQQARSAQAPSPARRMLESQRSLAVSKCREYLASSGDQLPDAHSAQQQRRMDDNESDERRQFSEDEEEDDDDEEDDEGEDGDEDEEDTVDDDGHEDEDEAFLHPELRTRKRPLHGEAEAIATKKVKNSSSHLAAHAPRTTAHLASARPHPSTAADFAGQTSRQAGFDNSLPTTAVTLLMQMCSKMDRMEEGFNRLGQVEQQLRDLKDEIAGNVMNSTASAASVASTHSSSTAKQSVQMRQDEDDDKPRDYVRAPSAEEYAAITGKTIASSEKMQWTKSHLRSSYAAELGRDALPSNKIIPLTFMMRHADGSQFSKAEVEVVTETAYALSREAERWPDRRQITKNGKRVGNRNYRYFDKYHHTELNDLFIRLGNAHEALQFCDEDRYKVKEFFMRRFKNACETNTKTEIKYEHEELAMTFSTALARVKGKKTSKIIQVTSTSGEAEEAFSEDGSGEPRPNDQGKRAGTGPGRKPKATTKRAKKVVARSVDSITSDEEPTDNGEGGKGSGDLIKTKQAGRKGPKPKASGGAQPERPKARRKGGPPTAATSRPGHGGAALGQVASHLPIAQRGTSPDAPAPYRQGETGITPTLAISNVGGDSESVMMATRHLHPPPPRPASPSRRNGHGFPFDQNAGRKQAGDAILGVTQDLRGPLQLPMAHERLPSHYGQILHNNQLYQRNYGNSIPPPAPFSPQQTGLELSQQHWGNQQRNMNGQDYASYASHASHASHAGHASQSQML
ncbi:hypothetical protein OC834_007508, partial [Tilletia horrida]